MSGMDIYAAVRLSLGVPTVARPAAKPPRPKRGELYLGGPIPWAWIRLAAGLPGQALAVGLALWLKARLAKSAEVGFSLSRSEELVGVKRDAASRGLDALERAGLISVVRGPGRMPRVTILPPPGDSAEPSTTRAGDSGPSGVGPAV